MKVPLGYLSGVVLFIGFIFYLKAIAKGKVSSNRVTWGVWILVNALFCVSYYMSVGLVSSIWAPLVYLIGTILVFIFLLKYGGKGHWTWVEKIVLCGVGVVLLSWSIFQ